MIRERSAYCTEPSQSLTVSVERLRQGDPPPQGAGLFGASLAPREADIVIVPAPWDGTSSYGKGSAQTPGAIVAASHQLDLEDVVLGRPYERGITMIEPHPEFPVGRGTSGSIEAINADGEAICRLIRQDALDFLEQGKRVGVLGGEHSVALGLLEALASHETDRFGILQIDAHFDLREKYQGYDYSHASIMDNALKLDAVATIVSVGVRDFCRSERERVHQDKRLVAFTDSEVFERMQRGSWHDVVDAIVDSLPASVYISFDIDGLDPKLCPSTGTPVPGGLSYHQATTLIERVARSKQVIGFDLTEVAPADEGEWDLNVGARVLYKLCGAVACGM